MKYVELDEIDSSNEYIKRNINTLEHLSIVRCHYQIGGKGRNGHGWKSHKGNDLLMSILLKEFDDPTKVHQITQVIALAIVEALKSYDVYASIKWPNDIYVGDLKICGILVETVYDPDFKGVIIGVGLNINSTGEYQSMANCRGRTFPINEVMVRILTQFLLYYKIYLQGSYRYILEKANQFSFLKGKWIAYREYGLVTFQSLNEDGTLTIKDMQDNEYRILCNEISLHREKITI